MLESNIPWPKAASKRPETWAPFAGPFGHACGWCRYPGNKIDHVRAGAHVELTPGTNRNRGWSRRRPISADFRDTWNTQRAHHFDELEKRRRTRSPRRPDCCNAQYRKKRGGSTWLALRMRATENTVNTVKHAPFWAVQSRAYGLGFLAYFLTLTAILFGEIY